MAGVEARERQEAFYREASFYHEHRHAVELQGPCSLDKWLSEGWGEGESWRQVVVKLVAQRSKPDEK